MAGTSKKGRQGITAQKRTAEKTGSVGINKYEN